MKAKVLLFLFLVVLIGSYSGFAHLNLKAAYCDSKIDNDNIQQSRVYVRPEQIHIDSQGIYVQIGGNLYQVAQICQDENGFYIPHAEFWKYCARGHPNPPWRLICQVCQLPL